MRVVIAPDKFKGTLNASEVIDALTSGIVRVEPGACVVGVPMADGGEGTLDAALVAGFEERRLEVTGPNGKPVCARYGMRIADGGARASDRGTEPDPALGTGDNSRSVGTPMQERAALIELAEASGLTLVTDTDPLHATSRGTGELIVRALAEGATDITLAIGGSASTDGGAGLLSALGAQLLDSRGGPIGPGGVGLLDLDRVDLSELDTRVAHVSFTLATDVRNPLLGPSGAAAVFARQKGASAEEVAILERGLQNWARVLSASCNQNALGTEVLRPAVDSVANFPGAGAAGGVGYGVLTVLGRMYRSARVREAPPLGPLTTGVRLRPGVEVVREFTGLDEKLRNADLVITGEGSLDEQSLAGKTPVGVARAVRETNPVVPVIAVCGRTALSDSQARGAGFDAVFALTEVASEVEAMTNPRHILTEIGARIAGR